MVPKNGDTLTRAPEPAERQEQTQFPWGLVYSRDPKSDLTSIATILKINDKKSFILERFMLKLEPKFSFI